MFRSLFYVHRRSIRHRRVSCTCPSHFPAVEPVQLVLHWPAAQCQMQSINIQRSFVRSARLQQQRLAISCSSSRSSSSCSTRPTAQQQQAQSRRQLLLQSSALLLALQAGRAAADEAEDLERQLPGLPLPAAQKAAELPKRALHTAYKLIACHSHGLCTFHAFCRLSWQCRQNSCPAAPAFAFLQCPVYYENNCITSANTPGSAVLCCC
jgi:hypothetical protein